MIEVKFSRIASLSLALSLAVIGCKGSTGPAGANGTNGPTGPAGPVTLTAETCILCHGTGQMVETASMHTAAAANPLAHNNATITSVTIPNAATTGGAPTVVFTVKDPSGNPVGGLTSFGITVARLVPDTAVGSSNWQSYINRDFSKDGTPSPGGWMEQSVPYPAFTAAPVASCTEAPAGTYTCVLADDLSSVQPINTNYPVVTVAYDPTLKIRVGVQSNAPTPGQVAQVITLTSPPWTTASTITVQPTPPFNAVYDLDPATGSQVTPDPRALVTMAACNACHQQLAHHGGRRLDPAYCATCHNPSSYDPKSLATDRQTVDMKRIIHKIHMGEHLPSVLAGGTSTINGDDFTKVAFPQDPGNCTACHQASDTWKTAPSIAACAGCHDLTYFGPAPTPTGYTPHSGGEQPSDSSTCALCHATGKTYAVDVKHAWGPGGLPGVAKTSLSSSYKYAIVGATSTGPGQMPVVTVSVTNGSGTGVDIKVDPAWTSLADGASRLAVDIGWSTKDYQNVGSGSNPGQAISIDVLKNGVATATPGQYTVTSTVAIPSTATGTLAVAMEGHPADTTVGAGTTTSPHSRIPIPSVVRFFGITDTTAVARRQTIDPKGCNGCHGTLSAHGNNRTLSSTDKNLICVICHNTEATDIKRRPTTGTTLDGLAEASVDFKKLIHGVHGAKFSLAGPVIYGFGGSANDFRDVLFPGILQNCTACHIPGTYNTSAALDGTTISTGVLSDPSDNLRITRNAATCSACHASYLEIDHMQQNGGVWGITQSAIDALNK